MTWRTDMENAPKGKAVEFVVEVTVRAFWDEQVGRWVTCTRHNFHCVKNAKAWRLADERVEPT